LMQPIKEGKLAKLKPECPHSSGPNRMDISRACRLATYLSFSPFESICSAKIQELVRPSLQ
jgi:hypothetical protein